MTIYHSNRRPVEETPRPTSPTDRPRPGRRTTVSVAMQLSRVAVISAALMLTLGGAAIMQRHAAYEHQSAANREVREQIVQALKDTRLAASQARTSAYWIQSALDRGDKPYEGGSVWHIDATTVDGERAIIARGNVSVESGIGIECPGAWIGFDAGGRRLGQAMRVRIESADPGESFFVDVQSDGSIISNGLSE